MKIVFPSPKRGGMGVTKCQTDRQCADQTTTWLVTDAGRAPPPPHIVPMSPFSSTFISTTIRLCWMEAACYPQSSGVVFAAFGLWQLHPQCGAVSDLPLRGTTVAEDADAVMRGPRCILGSSLHIFQPFPLKMWGLETLAPGTTILRDAELQQRGKQGSDLWF